MDHRKALVSRHLPATLLASLVFAAGCATVGEIDSMGGSEFQKIRAQTPVSDDAGLRAYVGCIADAIIAELPEPYA
jgi:hypothetical protein